MGPSLNFHKCNEALASNTSSSLNRKCIGMNHHQHSCWILTNRRQHMQVRQCARSTGHNGKHNLSFLCILDTFRFLSFSHFHLRSTKARDPIKDLPPDLVILQNLSWIFPDFLPFLDFYASTDLVEDA